MVLRDLASGKETDLPSPGPHPDAGPASWSPDDTWVVYGVSTEAAGQVAAVHPDGSGFHLLTEGLDGDGGGYGVAGWNLHDGALLVANRQTTVQLDPATGAVAWKRPLVDLVGAFTAGAEPASFTISPDGRQLIYARDTDEQEIPALGDMAEMSNCLVVADFPTTGTWRRVTPKAFAVGSVCVSLDGTSVYLEGTPARDMHPFVRRGWDGLHTKPRLYRYDLATGKLTPLALRNAGGFSLSRE